MKAYTFLANGFETVEALAVVDLLKRAGVEVVTVAVGEDKTITSAQKIPVVADMMVSEGQYTDADLIFLPGGMPGTTNLEANETVMTTVKKQYESGRLVAAICAAPSIFGHLHMLQGRKATCFPGFEQELLGAEYQASGVVTDGNVVTARGMGKSLELGFTLIEILLGKEKAEGIAKAVQFL